jgi:hypothetical protein
MNSHSKPFFTEDGHNPDEVYEEFENQTALHAAAISGSLIVLHILVQVSYYNSFNRCPLLPQLKNFSHMTSLFYK